MISLQSNDFQLFGLAPRFTQDRAAIDASWKRLQREAHPDRFADQGAAAQRLAMQWSVRINEAHSRLKDPLRRAALLCELGGVPIEAQRNTAMPGEFLVQQMQWREALEEATDAAALQAIADEAQDWQRETVAQLTQCLDIAPNLSRAAGLVRMWMFVEKFLNEVHARMDAQ